VVLHWDTDKTDVDLHVVDPTGNVCSWQKPKSPFGGGLENDCTDGFGPETFRIREALPGTWVVRVNYYQPDKERVRPRTRAYVTVVTRAGTPQAKVTHGTVELLAMDEMKEIARVQVDEG
jgi:uncharacterized protein YfaP (DUF2135 family)